jgi:hypothetical protein
MVRDESAILDILEAAARIHRSIKGSARLRIVRLGNRTYVKREAPHALTLSALASHGGSGALGPRRGRLRRGRLRRGSLTGTASRCYTLA